MKPVSDIIAAIQSPTTEDSKLITRAYDFGKKAHEGHTRNSGEPYFIHPIEVAISLAKLGMDSATITAGLLHDSIEDGLTTEEEVSKEFGEEVFFLIDGVTKLGKLKYRGMERHAESLRRLLVATSEDVRVLIIKLMDRLHNMQTLEFVRPDKRERIAKETLEIYAPLAERLGMGFLKRDLEDLAFPYVAPEDYKKAKDILAEQRKEIEGLIDTVAKKVKKELGGAGITNFRTEIRVKGLYSLWKKLERKNGDLSKIYDILALRVIISTTDECYRVLGIIHSLWRPLPGRIKDYIAFPKPNGYKSIHTTVLIGNGISVEVQIRTEEMNQHAEFGIASHLGYKQGASTRKSGDTGSMTWLAALAPRLMRFKVVQKGESMTEHARIKALKDAPKWIRDIANAGETLPDSAEFVESLKDDFFSHRIFAFTPTGDVVDLPLGATPIDFAYEIHSDIGNHMSGAKVGGKLVSLDTALKNGDVVEIVTKKSAKPTQKWLDIAKTANAKRHIRNQVGTKNPGTRL